MEPTKIIRRVNMKKRLKLNKGIKEKMRREYCWCTEEDGKKVERVRNIHPVRGTYVWVCPNCESYMESNVER